MYVKKSVFFVLQIQGEAGAQAVQYKGVFGTVLGIARHEGPKYVNCNLCIHV